MVPKSVMAAPMFSKRENLGRRICEMSSFLNPNSKHRDIVLNHYFNCSIGLTLPAVKDVPDDIQTLCMDEKSFMVHSLPLVELIDTDLIGAFVKSGRLCLLSHKTRIDNEDCVAVLPTGHLILHLTKDTYECLGMEGKPAAFPHKNPDKFVIQIDLLEKCFRPEKKKYQQVLRCLKNNLHLQFDVIMNWTPDNEALCPSSMQKYFQIKGYTCTETSVTCNQRLLKHLQVPVLDPDLTEFDKQDYDQDDVYEWLGGVAVSSCLSAEPDDFATTYSYQGPTQNVNHSVYVQYRGFFSPSTLYQVLEKLRHHTQTAKVPWASMTVHGFMDSPVSWVTKEHGFLTCGDNIYTLMVFPSQQYWCYKAFSSYDVIT